MSVWLTFILVLGIICLSFFLLMQYFNFTHRDPPKTTTLDKLNVEIFKEKVRGVSTVLDGTKYYVAPITYTGDLETNYAKMLDILKSYPRAKVIKEKPNYLYIRITSLLFRFIDDIEVFFDDEEKIIHYKSGPRFGAFDFGVNRERYSEIKSKFMGEPIEIQEGNKKGISRENIPGKELQVLIIVSAICSAFIFLSYLIWMLIDNEYFQRTGVAILVIDIILTIFSSSIVFMLLKQKSITPNYVPTMIWIAILIIFAILSQIYLIILFAVVQLVVDIRFYKIIESIHTS
ncbi:MAG: DUF1499 domain-containing protein [Candidatus Lokiarchaeota archaeon]|nr:DUF1499 domain-containing protein [Candidatus Lokiarchaeota archaeon]